MSLACYRKKSYATEALAMSVVYKLRAQGRAQIDAAKCEVCKKWHLSATKLVPEGLGNR